MSNILFIFEGEKTERMLFKSLNKHFLNDGHTLTCCAFGTDIYQLYNLISDDRDLDTFPLLKDQPLIGDVLKDFNRNDFAEIYLFFDYDGHATKADDSKLNAMLELFNEETEAGKLYVNYPMVESIKHISDSTDFMALKVEAKNNIRYKNIVSCIVNIEYSDFRKYTKETWRVIIETHLKKMNFIISDRFELPTTSFSQIKLFNKQREKYIDVDCTIGVLNGFPVFLFDYYGSGTLYKVLQ